jgi:anti-sigma B factor antagonist
VDIGDSFGLNLACEVVDAVLVVHAVGDLDALTAPRLAEYVREHVASTAPRHVALDLSRIDFLGSSGLSMLAALARTDLGAPLHLTGVGSNPRVARPLDLMGLTRLFDIQDDLTALREPPPATTA